MSARRRYPYQVAVRDAGSPYLWCARQDHEDLRDAYDAATLLTSEHGAAHVRIESHRTFARMDGRGCDDRVTLPALISYAELCIRLRSQGARRSRAGMHYVTEDDPSVYGSHLLGREGTWIHKGEQVPPHRREAPKAEEE